MNTQTRSSIVNHRVQVQFWRPLISNDTVGDKSLDACQTFQFVVSGGLLSETGDRILKHNTKPVSFPVCDIRESCSSLVDDVTSSIKQFRTDDHTVAAAAKAAPFVVAFSNDTTDEQTVVEEPSIGNDVAVEDKPLTNTIDDPIDESSNAIEFEDNNNSTNTVVFDDVNGDDTVNATTPSSLEGDVNDIDVTTLTAIQSETTVGDVIESPTNESDIGEIESSTVVPTIDESGNDTTEADIAPPTEEADNPDIAASNLTSTADGGMFVFVLTDHSCLF